MPKRIPRKIPKTGSQVPSRPETAVEVHVEKQPDMPQVSKHVEEHVKEVVQPVKSFKERFGIPKHLVVDALAGTGKTFTIVEGVKRILGMKSSVVGSSEQEAIWAEMMKGPRPNTIAVLAFNSAIAEELKKRIPSPAVAMTSHGFGLKAIAIAGIKSKLDVQMRVDKDELIVTQWLLQWLTDQGYTVNDVRDFYKASFPQFINGAKQLLNLCKQNLLHIDEMLIDEAGSADALSAIEELIETYGVELLLKSKEGSHGVEVIPPLDVLLADTLRQSATERRYHTFTDMIWWPSRLNLEIHKYDLLLVDERQDLNRAQQELVMRAGKRIVLVGDVNQAIYGFAGADFKACESMNERLKKTVNGCCVLPLTMTRRCSKAVVDLANKYRPTGLSALPDASGGEVVCETEEKYLRQVKSGDMILCRTNNPLIAAAMSLFREGRKIRIQGREFAQRLTWILDGLDTENSLEAIPRLDSWYHEKLEKLNSWKFCSPDIKIALEDQYIALRMLLNRYSTCSEVIRHIETIFGMYCPTCGAKLRTDTCKKCGSLRDPEILLTSIHRAKGLECHDPESTVWWLRYDGCPSSMARTPGEKEQERNLCYVAITRAKNRIALVKTKAKNSNEDE